MAFSTIGTLSVNVVANTQRLAQGIAASQKLIKGFVATATAAFSSRALISSLQTTAEHIDAIGKAAERLGETTESMAGMTHGAELAGMSSERLASGLTRLTRNVSEAAAGIGEAQDALTELNVSASRLNKLKPSEQLGEIAEALRGIENQADRVRLTERLFGRGGSEFLVMLQDGRAGLQAMQADAEKLGLTFSTKTSKDVQSMNDNIDRMNKSIEGAKTSFLGFASPWISKAADSYADVFRGKTWLNPWYQAELDRATKTGVMPGLSPQEMQERMAQRIAESRIVIPAEVTERIGKNAKLASDAIFNGLSKVDDVLDEFGRKAFVGRTMGLFAPKSQQRGGGDPFLTRLLIAAFPSLVQGATGLGLKGLSTLGQRQRMPLAALERGTVEAFTASRANLDDVPKKQLKVQERIEGGIKELVGIVREKMPEFIVKSIPGI